MSRDRKETLPAAQAKGSASEAFGVAAMRGHLTLWTRGGEVPSQEPGAEPAVTGPLARAQDPEGRAILEFLSSSRELGLLILGRPGTGKSTLLLHLILEDLRAGTACCVLDPHGDLVQAVLERAPNRASTRILLFDPLDTLRPVGLDLLDARTPLEEDHCVQFMIALFEELFQSAQQGPILHQAISNAMRLAMETGGSLAEVPALLCDKALLGKRLSRSQNPWVIHYFEDVWLHMSGSSRGEYLAYVTSKLARFLDDSVLRGIFGQKEAPDLEAHLEAGGAVLAPLSRGTLGEVNARILGMVLLHKLERITMRRDALVPAERRPLRIYIDECHDLVTDSLSRFLAASRKFNVALTLADQQLELLPGRFVESALGTMGHGILFRQGASFELFRLAGLLWPRFGERELLSAPNFEALARVTRPDGGQRLGRLHVPRPRRGSTARERRTRDLARERFGQPRHEVDRKILEGLGWLKDDAAASMSSPEADCEAPDCSGSNDAEDPDDTSQPSGVDRAGVDWVTIRVPVPRPSASRGTDPASQEGDQDP